MSLAKIPIISILTFVFKMIITPPQPPPSVEEVVPSTKTDYYYLRRYRLDLARFGQFFLAAVEIATIIANKNSSSPLSRGVLSILLLKGGNPGRLCFSSIGVLGAAFWLCGAALRIRTYQNLGRFFRFEISIQKNHELIKTGPYAYVRHPSYTGLTLATIGWFMWNLANGSWIRESGFLDSTMGRIILVLYLVPTLLHMQYITLSRMSKEDEALRKEFGKEWDEWAKKVPYSLIPGVY